MPILIAIVDCQKKFEEYEEERPPTHPEESPALIVSTEFPDWCEASFAKPLLSKGQELDPNSELFVRNQIRDRRHAEKKRKARAELEKRGILMSIHLAWVYINSGM